MLFVFMFYTPKHSITHDIAIVKFCGQVEYVPEDITEETKTPNYRVFQKIFEAFKISEEEEAEEAKKKAEEEKEKEQKEKSEKEKEPKEDDDDDDDDEDKDDEVTTLVTIVARFVILFRRVYASL